MSARHEHDTIEAYLERLRTLLTGMPEDEIDQAIKEMGQHLQTLVEAEVGVSYADAVQRAVAKFGEPDLIARTELWGYMFRLARKGRNQHKRDWKRSAMLWVGYFAAMATALAALHGLSSAINMSSLVSQVLSGVVMGIVGGVMIGLTNSQSSNAVVNDFLAGTTADQRQAMLSTLDEGRWAVPTRLPENPSLWNRLILLRRQFLIRIFRKMGASAFTHIHRTDKPASPLVDVLWMVGAIGVLYLVSPSFRSYRDIWWFGPMMVTMPLATWLTKLVLYTRNVKRSLAQ